MRWMTEAHSGNRKYEVRQGRNFGNTVNVVTHNAYGATPKARSLASNDKILHYQCGINRSIQKSIHMVIGKGMAPYFAQIPNAAAIATEQQENWASPYPTHIRHQLSYFLSLIRVLYVNYGNLLQIGFCRRRQSTGKQEVQCILCHRLIQKPSMSAVRENRSQGFRAWWIIRNIYYHAKPLHHQIRKIFHFIHSFPSIPMRHLRASVSVFCIFVCLAACAPRVQDFHQGLMPAAIVDPNFITEDGKELPLKIWQAKGDTKAVMIALHGFNMYRKYFDEPATWWSGRGITTYAYDQRGFGASPDARIWGGSMALAADARAFVTLISQRHPGKPVYLLGESMGAAVALLALTEDFDAKIAGIILVAPGMWGGKSMHPMLRFGLWLSAHIMPWNTATGRSFKRRASDNIPMLRALGKDPLIIRHTRIDAVYGVTQLMGRAYEAVPKIKNSILVLYGENDEIVPAKPVYELVTRLPSKPKFALYPNGWHMLLRDLQAKIVWKDIANWISHPNMSLPSGTDVKY